MIKVIIFDCFGVLVHGSLDYLYQSIPAEYHQELSDLSKRSDYGYVPRSEYIAKIAELTDKTPQEIGESLRSQHIRDENLLDFVRAIHTTHKTVLLSNVGQSVIDQLFTADELSSLFHEVVLSSDVGMVKPHPEIYEYVAEKLGVSENECVMIDDLLHNIDGAAAVGMKGIVYTSLPHLQQSLKEVLDA